jgi:hypothetical protein
LSVETGRPIEGSYGCIEQEPPDVVALCDVNCQLLAGIALLRYFADERNQSLISALTAEAWAVRSLKSTQSPCQ